MRVDLLQRQPITKPSVFLYPSIVLPISVIVHLRLMDTYKGQFAKVCKEGTFPITTTNTHLNPGLSVTIAVYSYLCRCNLAVHTTYTWATNIK